MLEYGMITLAVILFGLQFFCNDGFHKSYGSGTVSTFVFSFFSSLSGLIIIWMINRFAFGFTPFTLLIATLAAANGILYTFCSLKAFEHINISLYSIFAMLGGMVIPFVFGIAFYGEPLTPGNVICLALITAALFFTFKKDGKNTGAIYYTGVFVLNGLSGVLSKIFSASELPKTSAAVYSIWRLIISAAFSGIMIIILRKSMKKPSLKALGFTLGNGFCNSIGNYLLLLALLSLPASVQYPFVTGGTMIVCAVIGFFTGEKPGKREIISIALSMAGILALILI